jgi:predicted Zn-dependent protease with MMP-like domain
MAWWKTSEQRFEQRIDDALEAGDLARARSVAAKAVAAYPADGFFRLVQGDIALESGLIREAAGAYAHAVSLNGENMEALAALADARLELADFAGAEQALDAALALAPKEALLHYLHAVLFELTHRRERAEEAYARAERLDPERYFRPHRVSSKAFDATLRAAIAELPEDLAEALAGLSVVVRRFPSANDSPAELYNPLLLGLFEGVPLPFRSMEDPMASLGARITLFQGNLERQCATREELIEEIHITLLHELGHFLGHDEEAVWKRGLR